MNQRLAYLIAGVLLVALGTAWFTYNYKFVRERVQLGMSGDARANWLLAARMLLADMGSHVQESSDLNRLAGFPVAGSLFLADRSQMDPLHARLLLDWVRRGGHLVVAAEPALKRDPLLDPLGVKVEAVVKDAVREPREENIQLADGVIVRAALPQSPVLSDENERAAWWHASGGATRMLQIPEGAGAVTVMASFGPFSNRNIGRLDHAELLWRLASDEGNPVDVWLVRHLDVQSLPMWLLKYALPAVIGLAVFIVVALWRVIPRFGPLQPPAVPDRRSLNEHLSAMGRFYSSQRALPRLLQILRRDARELMNQRAPETHGQQGPAQLKAAARVTGLRPRDLLHALSHPGDTPREFTAAVRVMAAVRQCLLSGAAVIGGRAARPQRRDEHKARADMERLFGQNARTDAANPDAKERI